MLKLNGVGRLSLRLAPTGLTLGTRRLHYAWVIGTIASRSLSLTLETVPPGLAIRWAVVGFKVWGDLLRDVYALKGRQECAR